MSMEKSWLQTGLICSVIVITIAAATAMIVRSIPEQQRHSEDRDRLRVSLAKFEATTTMGTNQTEFTNALSDLYANVMLARPVLAQKETASYKKLLLDGRRLVNFWRAYLASPEHTFAADYENLVQMGAIPQSEVDRLQADDLKFFKADFQYNLKTGGHSEYYRAAMKSQRNLDEAMIQRGFGVLGADIAAVRRTGAV